MTTGHSYPTCCGITIVAGFGQRTAAQKLNSSEVDAYRLDLEEKVHTWRGVGLLLIALNTPQIESGVGRIAVEVGFRRIGKYFYHPGHGHNIQLYGYYQHPDHIKDHPDAVKPLLDKKVLEEPKKKLVRRKIRQMFG